MSSFDPTQFLSQTITEANETRFTPIPEGEYLASISKLGMRTLDKTGAVILDITWDILDENLKATLGLDKPQVRQSCFLDLDANGKIASGQNKNVDLGRVRDALGQNNAGQPWGPMMLNGAGPAKLKIGQRVDPNDSSKIYSDVKMVAKAA